MICLSYPIPHFTFLTSDPTFLPSDLSVADILVSLMIFKHTNHTLTSGPLHMLFPLPGRLLPQVSHFFQDFTEMSSQ